jgi:hypothetical protein
MASGTLCGYGLLTPSLCASPHIAVDPTGLELVFAWVLQFPMSPLTAG